jgi:Kef-type K+ transport system membrane component KefB
MRSHHLAPVLTLLALALVAPRALYAQDAGTVVPAAADAAPVAASADAAPAIEIAPEPASTIDAAPAPVPAPVIDAGVPAVRKPVPVAIPDAGPAAAPISPTPPAVGPPPTDVPPATTPAPPPVVDPSLVGPTVKTPPEAVPDVGKGANRATVLIKLISGLVALMVLAYLGSHRKVVRLQERLGISGVIAAGFPFVALGLIARQPEIGVLTPDVVHRLQPILHFGLGWLGFIIGAQLDIRVLDKVPTGTAYLIVVEALAPFAITAASVGAAMIAIGGADWHDNSFWRDMIILGAAAAMTAPKRFRGFANRTWREGRSVDHLLAQLDEIVGVIGLLFVAAYFRPEGMGGWAIPGTAWVFISIGLGVVIGVLIFAMIRVPVANTEFFAVVLGSIAFGAGLAGYLYLSPISVCFIAGCLVTNFPNHQRDSVFRILNHLERPIHLLFLIIVGAMWDVFDWRGWVLVPMFVAARVVGKWAGIFAAKKTVGADMPQGFADNRALVTPVSALAIALVISAHGVGSGGGLWLTTVVIGGAALTEVLVSITSPPKPIARPSTQVPVMGAAMAVGQAVDELDAPPMEPEPTDVGDEPTDERSHERGPVYMDDESLPPMVPRDPTLPPSKLKDRK